MFLDNFRDKIISRGLDYYFNENVRDAKMIEPDVFAGIVEGNESYNVTIDINNVHNSKCSCPYGDLCKHMVALYFQVFPDMAEEYHGYYGYDDEWNDDDDDWDDYDDTRYNYRFVEPIKYNQALDEFVDGLNAEECKKLLKKLLNNNKENTFDTYLKNFYTTNNEIKEADRINQYIIGFLDNSFLDRYCDYGIDIILDEDKEFLKNSDDKDVREYLKSLVLDKRLYCYKTNAFLVETARSILSTNELHNLKDNLKSYMSELKMAGIPSMPKSNVLISVYELSNKSISEVFTLFNDNLRYEEFVEYVIRNFGDTDELYILFRNEKRNEYRYRQQLSDIYKLFYNETGNKEAEQLSHYYGFINNLNMIDLDELVTYDNFYDDYYAKIEKSGNDYVRINLYAKLNEKKKLYEYLMSNNDLNHLCFYASFLDEEYHDELLKLFKETTYEKLNGASKREEYAGAAVYIRAIRDLEDGYNLVDDFIQELKNDDRFRKRSALFDEIRISLRR